MYSSTCFGLPHAHHQLERGDSSVVGRGRADRPDHDQQHCHHHAPTVKSEAATAVVELLMMGVKTSETYRALHTSKHQVINLRNCCMWFVDLFETFSCTCFSYLFIYQCTQQIHPNNT